MRELATEYKVFPGEFPVVVVASRDSGTMDVTNIIEGHNLDLKRTVWVEHNLPERLFGRGLTAESWEIAFPHYSRGRYVLAESHAVPESIIFALLQRCEELLQIPA